MRDDVDRAGPLPRPSLGQRVRALGGARWTQVLSVALVVAVPITVVAAVTSLGRTDADVLGDLMALLVGTVTAIVLAAGIDERLPPASRSIARWLSVLAVGYALAALSVVVAAVV